MSTEHYLIQSQSCCLAQQFIQKASHYNTYLPQISYFSYKNINKQPFMRKQRLGNDLHISHFIKEPENLKLLILAGTQVQKSEFQTIKRCINLIKLDLSNNGLKVLPISLQYFSSLKILYLHENHFDTFQSVNIKGCCTQYITLFNNPIKNYRRYLLNHLKNIKAIDKNIISTKQRNGYQQFRSFPFCTQMKWPLVDLQKELQSQNDYLNLLKGELLVLNDSYYRNEYTQRIEIYFRSMLAIGSISSHISFFQQQTRRKQNLIRKVANQWKSYTKKRVLLRGYLENVGKQHLLLNRIQYKRYLRGDEANRVISNYVNHIRKVVKAKRLLKRELSNYKQVIKDRKAEQQQGVLSYRFYTKQSQWQTLNKIFLYIKKLLFNHKKYELCEQFQNVLKRSKREYLIVRQKQQKKKASIFLQKINQMINSIIIEDYSKKRSKLYDKNGHTKIIKVKTVESQLSEDQKLKMSAIDQKLSNIYKKYDRLVQWQTDNYQIYDMFNRLVRYYNAGNITKILKNTTAYFQTQIPNQEVSPLLHQKIYVFSQQMIKRIVSAVKIQSFWRKVQTIRKVDTIYDINLSRAATKIQRWRRNLPFFHRNRFTQQFLFYQRNLTSNFYYIQMFIYMGLPKISNTLNFDIQHYSKFLPYQNMNQYRDLYQLLHKGTKIRTLQINGQSWIKIQFPSVYQATKRLKLLRIFTYRLPFSSSIKLFRLEQCCLNLDEYESAVSQVYQLNRDTKHLRIKNRPIDNPNTVFVFEKGRGQTLQKTNQFISKQNFIQFKISMFVFSQGRKALKVQTDLSLFQMSNIYLDYFNNFSSERQVSISFQEQRHSIPLLLDQVSKTRKLLPIKDIRQPKNKGSYEYSSRNKSRSIMRCKDQTEDSIRSLKLISESMPFRKR